MKRFLFLVSFGIWHVHHQFDAVVGAALQMRGARALALCCDGSMRNCTCNAHNDPSFCARCFKSGKDLLERFHIPVVTASSLLQSAERARIDSVADSVTDLSQQTMVYNGVPVGRHAIVSLCVKLREKSYDSNNPEHVSLFRNYIWNNMAYTVIAKKLFQTYHPDALVCYNASHMSYGAVYDMARAQSLPILIHERGNAQDSFSLLPFRFQDDTQTHAGMQEELAQSPTSPEQIATIRHDMDTRKGGMLGSFKLANAGTEPPRDVSLRLLRIDPARPVVMACLSGQWEYKLTGFTLPPLYIDQIEWLHELAALCRRENATLLVKYHPLMSGAKSYPMDGVFLAKLLDVQESMGPHVFFLSAAEKISSYDLFYIADIVTAAYSTTVFESLRYGCKGVYTARNELSVTFQDTIASRQEYLDVLQRHIRERSVQPYESFRNYYRAYARNSLGRRSFRFKSFGFLGSHGADIRISSLTELMPGQDPMLDHVCDHLLHKTPLYAQSTALEATEYDLLYPEYQSMLAQRAEARALLEHQDQTAVDILVLSPPHHAVADRTQRTLKRSRHTNYTLTIDRTVYAHPLQLIEALYLHTSQTSADLIYICLPNLHIDEAMLAWASALHTERNEAEAVVFGCYIREAGGPVTLAYNTVVDDSLDFKKIINACPVFAHPLAMLSLCVWKKEALRRLLVFLLKQRVHSHEAIFGKVCQYIFFNDNHAVCNTAMPFVIFSTEG